MAWCDMNIDIDTNNGIYMVHPTKRNEETLYTGSSFRSVHP